MDLRHLTDQCLLTDTKILASRERELLTRLLHHLKEIDRRRLYSDLGYSSLFEYCVKELGYASSSAYRRIQSARMLEVLPEIEKKIEDGATNLTNLAKASEFFNKNEIGSKEEKLEIIGKIENLSSRDCEKELMKLAGESSPAPEDKIKRISEAQFRYSITMSEETSKLIDDVSALLHKKCSLDELIKFMATETITALTKKKFKLTKSLDSLPAPGVKRKIPAAVQRAVFQRDQSCTKCGTKFRLQFDHRTPYSLGGTNGTENIRLLCFSCNQRERQKQKLKGPPKRP